MAAFEPTNFFANGVGAILAFGIAAFMGFESGAIYSEEVKTRVEPCPGRPSSP